MGFQLPSFISFIVTAVDADEFQCNFLPELGPLLPATWWTTVPKSKDFKSKMLSDPAWNSCGNTICIVNIVNSSTCCKILGAVELNNSFRRSPSHNLLMNNFDFKWTNWVHKHSNILKPRDHLFCGGMKHHTCRCKLHVYRRIYQFQGTVTGPVPYLRVACWLVKLQKFTFFLKP